MRKRRSDIYDKSFLIENERKRFERSSQNAPRQFKAINTGVREALLMLSLLGK